jgi:hypothetical protein
MCCLEKPFTRGEVALNLHPGAHLRAMQAEMEGFLELLTRRLILVVISMLVCPPI